MSNQVRRAASDSDSESESESDEEKTKSKVISQPQEPPKKPLQQNEAESESESDSDRDSEPESRYNILKRDSNSKMETKATVADKRARDVNGARATSADGPVTSKNRKGAKDDKARLQPEKMSSPVKKGEKAEQGMRGARAAVVASKADKVKAVPAAEVENAKPQAAGRKRKASPPPPGASVTQQAQKVELEKPLPVKPRKPALWTMAVEQVLASHLRVDHRRGLVIPNTKGDPYWEKLLKRLPLEGDPTELQLCDKVRRMKGRYNTLKERFKGEGAKIFKSQHEEQLFDAWDEVWGSRVKIPQPIAQSIAVEEDSDEEAEENRTAFRQVNKSAEGLVGGGESSSDEENEEDAENAKRKTAGLNQINAASKVIPEPVVVTPFVSKPRLEFTPLFPKADKRKVSARVEEAAASHDQYTKDVARDDDGEKGDVVSLAEAQLKHLKDETRAFFQELRGSCFQAMEEQRNGSLTAGLGDFAFAGRLLGVSGIAERFSNGSLGQAAVELQKKWREHKIQELALLSERLQLLQEQCRLQQDELKLQNQMLEH